MHHLHQPAGFIKQWSRLLLLTFWHTLWNHRDKIAVSSGVPQGSVLGPIPFLPYINDLPDQVRSRVRLFADATAIYLAISSEGELITLQNDVFTLEKWEQRWDMSFNPSKCQVLHITRAKCPIQTRYILHGTVLESVPSAKYLGGTISDNLSWTPPPPTHTHWFSLQESTQSPQTITVGMCFNSVVPAYSNRYYKTWSCTAGLPVTTSAPLVWHKW